MGFSSIIRDAQRTLETMYPKLAAIVLGSTNDAAEPTSEKPRYISVDQLLKLNVDELERILPCIPGDTLYELLQDDCFSRNKKWRVALDRICDPMMKAATEAIEAEEKSGDAAALAKARALYRAWDEVMGMRD